MLDAIWENPNKSETVFQKISKDNEDVYNFEKMLEDANSATTVNKD